MSDACSSLSEAAVWHQLNGFWKTSTAGPGSTVTVQYPEYCHIVVFIIVIVVLSAWLAKNWLQISTLVFIFRLH